MEQASFEELKNQLMVSLIRTWMVLRDLHLGTYSLTTTTWYILQFSDCDEAPNLMKIFVI